MSLKKAFIAILVFSALFLFPFKPALATEGKTSTVVVSKEQIFTENHFQAAESLIFSGTVDGDLFLAGGSVTFDGEVSGDLFIAGGKVTVNGKIGQNLRAAGGTVAVNADIGRNLLLLGGNLEINKNTQIVGSLVAAGGNLESSAKTGLGGNIAAGRAYLNGTFGGNLTAVVDKELLFGPEARINGNLKYQSQEEIPFHNQNFVAGAITYSPLSAEAKKLTSIGKNALPHKTTLLVNKLKTPAKLFDVLFSLAIGLLFLHFFSRFTVKVSNLFTSHFFRSILTGIIYFVLLPLGSLLLILTIIGIPFVLVLGLLTGILVIVSRAIGAFAVGHQLLLRLEKKDRRGWALLLGLLITYLVSALPFFGPLYNVVLAGATSGAIVTYFFQKFQRRKPAKS